MSNTLRQKLLRSEQLDQEQGPESKTITKAFFLQTAILNERLFNIELALQEKRPGDPQLRPTSAPDNSRPPDAAHNRGSGHEQADIIERLQVLPAIDIDEEVERRATFLVVAIIAD